MTQRISSKLTIVHKWLFPIGWFGFLAFFVFNTLRSGAAQEDPIFLLAPIAMAVFGFLLMRRFTWDLADAVDDFGSYIIVRRNSTEVRVELKNIMNVSVSTLANPPRITLRLVEPTELGNEISFSPSAPFTLNPFARNPVGEALIERVYHARGERR